MNARSFAIAGTFTLLSFTATTVHAFSATVLDLLSQEQYAAQARRAEVERVLMLRNGDSPAPLLEPDFSTVTKSGKSNKKVTKNSEVGGGFGGAQTSTNKRWSKYAALAVLQKERLQEDGVLRINQALSPACCAALRTHVLNEVQITAARYQQSLQENSDIVFHPEDYYGIEPGRSCRTDLLLSLLPVSVSDALGELFDSTSGKLRCLLESLVTKEGTLYEMACVVTSKGSARQCIHPDLPFQATAPLYVVFLALQDVKTFMGPTTFLLGSNTQAARNAYDDTTPALDAFICSSQVCETTMKAGDLIVFDARTMHCGNANTGSDDESPDRALFNFSFRNPKVTGNLGYKGSMRPRYTSHGISLGDVLNIVDGRVKDAKYREPSTPPFAKYGDGLV